MECRKLEIAIISAKNLENVRLLGMKMRVHARFIIKGLPEPEKRTPTDTHGKTNPVWTSKPSTYTIVESMLNNCNTNLEVLLYATSKTGDKYIGQVNISLKQLFDSAAGSDHEDGGYEKGASKVDFVSAGRSAVLTLPVHVGCKKSQGDLTISYSFGEKVAISPTVMAERLAHGLLIRSA